MHAQMNNSTFYELSPQATHYISQHKFITHVQRLLENDFNFSKESNGAKIQRFNLFQSVREK